MHEIFKTHYNSHYGWILINGDNYRFNTGVYQYIRSTMYIENALYIHVYGQDASRKFNWLAKRRFNEVSSFKQLLISFNDVNFRLSDFLPIVVDLRFNIVLCTMNFKQLRIYTTYPFDDKPIQAFNGDSVAYTNWNHIFFALNNVNVNRKELKIIGNIQPPAIILVKSSAQSDALKIAGSDGQIFNLMAQYINGTFNFMSKKIRVNEYFDKAAKPYLDVVETEYIVYDSISKYITPSQ